MLKNKAFLGILVTILVLSVANFTLATADDTPPSVTNFLLNGGATYSNTGTVIATFDASDADSGLSHCEIDWADGGSDNPATSGVSHTYSDGPWAPQLFCIDNIGNITSVDTGIIVDTVGPTVSDFLFDGGAASNTTGTVTATFIADDSGSGLNHCELDWGDGSLDSAATSGATHAFADGSQTGTLLCLDNAGNSTALDSNSITVDTTTPDTTPPTSFVSTTPASVNNNNPFSITFAADDNIGVQSVRLFVRKNAGVWEDAFAGGFAGDYFFDGQDGTLNFSPSGDGTYDFYTIAQDTSGNSEASKTNPEGTTVVDTVAPVITLNGDAVVNLHVGDSYTDAGATADDGSTVVTTGSVDTTTVGTYVIHYNATDVAGNVATEVIRTVNVEVVPVVNTPPPSNPSGGGGGGGSGFVPTIVPIPAGQVLGAFTSNSNLAELLIKLLIAIQNKPKPKVLGAFTTTSNQQFLNAFQALINRLNRPH